ncbi:MAG: Cytochrome c, class [Gemmatimonadetes bacterium]|nr:Cytochrome c, class [Gemmatimonadota bacterium]
MVLIHAAVLAVLVTRPLHAGPDTLRTAGQTAESAVAVRRLAATAQLAAQEYGLGVVDGRVVAAAEVEEARLFLEEAKRSAGQLPPEWSAAAIREIDEVLVLVSRHAAPTEVASRVRRLTTTLSTGLGVSLDEVPGASPSLARGAEVYQNYCAACHGSLGAGDGPAAATLNPVPSNLADAAVLYSRSPLDFYRRITIGVVGTSMPAYETTLPAEDRWAVASYASLLRLPAAQGDVPASLTAFGTTARLSDSALGEALAASASGASVLARVAAVRSYQAPRLGVGAAATFTRVRTQIDEALKLAAERKPDEASARAFDAYMTFEGVERDVRAKNPSLATTLEGSFATLRLLAAGGAPAAELAQARATLLGQLENAERTLGDTLSPMSLFVQSFFLLVREGLEAILIIGALLTFLAKTGATDRKRDIHVGVGAAVLASLFTAVLLETVFQVTPARREVLEGAVMLTASVVLFYVSYWLLSKIEVARWNEFVRSRVQDAVTSGSALALAAAAFLAVYREGFETVLFYKALVLAGPAGSTFAPVTAGIALGSLVLVAVYYAINRFGVRLPLKPFFALTGLFLYYMAFLFAGRGIAELQEGGIIATTVLPWAPRIPALGIYPTLESLVAQGVLAALLLGALVWSFVLAPRRAVRAPAPVSRGPELVSEESTVDPAVVEGHRKVAPGTQQGLVRSLERMEGDLAALRAEVERMRDQLRKDQGSPTRK